MTNHPPRHASDSEGTEMGEREDIFGTRLYRTHYLVMPRLALEAMPVDWQRRMEALLVEADNAGLETPSYFVLRDDPSLTVARRDDPDDETSRISEYWSITDDPWANYRYGCARTLSAEAKAEGRP